MARRERSGTSQDATFLDALFPNMPPRFIYPLTVARLLAYLPFLGTPRRTLNQIVLTSRLVTKRLDGARNTEGVDPCVALKC